MRAGCGKPLDVAYNVVRVGGDESGRLDGVGIRRVVTLRAATAACRAGAGLGLTWADDGRPVRKKFL